MALTNFRVQRTAAQPDGVTYAAARERLLAGGILTSGILV